MIPRPARAPPTAAERPERHLARRKPARSPGRANAATGCRRTRIAAAERGSTARTLRHGTPPGGSGGRRAAAGTRSCRRTCNRRRRRTVLPDRRFASGPEPAGLQQPGTPGRPARPASGGGPCNGSVPRASGLSRRLKERRGSSWVTFPRWRPPSGPIRGCRAPSAEPAQSANPAWFALSSFPPG